MTERVCECGCGTALKTSRPQARYASAACRSKAWKARNGYRDPRKAAERAGKPSRSASPRRREGVTVYFPSVAMAESVRDAIWRVDAGIEPFNIIDVAILRRQTRA